MSFAAAAVGGGPTPPPSPDRKRIKRDDGVEEEENQEVEEHADDDVVVEEENHGEEHVEDGIQIAEEEPVVIVPNNIGNIAVAPLQIDLNKLPEEEGLDIIPNQPPMAIEEHPGLANEDFHAQPVMPHAVNPGNIAVAPLEIDLNELPKEEHPRLANDDFDHAQPVRSHAVNLGQAQFPPFEVLNKLSKEEVWSSNEMDHWMYYSHDVEAKAFIEGSARNFEEK